MSVAARLELQRRRVAGACARAQRRVEDVKIVAVSKGQPVSAIAECLAAGHRDVGESYVQEWQQKAATIDARWHFIGHLQTNKVGPVRGRVALIHSVDRLSLVDALSGADAPQDVLIQVNVSAEGTKSGCTPRDAPALVARAARAHNLRVRGLMTLPPPADDPEQVRPHFRALRELRDAIRATMSRVDAAMFSELSMGMSDDADVAIEEGATIVRIGTAVFGPRSTNR